MKFSIIYFNCIIEMSDTSDKELHYDDPIWRRIRIIPFISMFVPAVGTRSTFETKDSPANNIDILTTNED